MGENVYYSPVCLEVFELGFQSWVKDLEVITASSRAFFFYPNQVASTMPSHLIM